MRLEKELRAVKEGLHTERTKHSLTARALSEAEAKLASTCAALEAARARLESERAKHLGRTAELDASAINAQARFDTQLVRPTFLRTLTRPNHT